MVELVFVTLPAEGPITGRFGQVEGYGYAHRGLDIGCPVGTPIVAPAAGTIVPFTNDGSYGLGVCIDHVGTPWYSLMAHNSRLDVQIGDRVEARQQVALSGATGRVTGAHCHWQVCDSATFPVDISHSRDPLSFMGGTPPEMGGAPLWPIIIDVSNYDFDDDQDNWATWVADFHAAGIAGVIVGSQWPAKANGQLRALRDSGLPIVGTYAEPDVYSAIDLAWEFGASRVGLACERGSILATGELEQDLAAVKAAGLTPWIYGNRSDLIAIAGPFLATEKVWLANYGTNDPSHPRQPITVTDFGSGPVELIAHQFSSTIVVAGRNRDHSYWYEEDDLELTARVERLERVIVEEGQPVTVASNNLEAMKYAMGMEVTEGQTFTLDREQAMKYCDKQGIRFWLAQGITNDRLGALEAK